MTTAIKAAGGIAVALLVGGIAAGCGSAPATVPVAPSAPTHGSAPAPVPDNTGRVGSTFTLSPTDIYGQPAGGTYKIRLDKIVRVTVPDPCAKYSGFDQQMCKTSTDGMGPKPGTQVTMLHFWAQAIDANADPASLGVQALGSDGETHPQSLGTPDGYPEFGTDTLAWAGQHKSGWVMYELPKGVTIVSVKYEDIQAEATWNVGK